MRVFVNHIGFDETDYKTAVLELEQEAAEITAWLEADNGERHHAAVSGPERIPDWSEGCYCVLDFSDVRREGRTGLPDMPVERHFDRRSSRSPAIS